MRAALVVAGCLLLWSAVAQAAAIPSSVDAALMVERLRIDDPRTPDHILIAESVDRFAPYFKLAKTPEDRKRLYNAWRAYSNRIRARSRRRIDELWDQTKQEMLRPRGGGRRA